MSRHFRISGNLGHLLILISVSNDNCSCSKIADTTCRRLSPRIKNWKQMKVLPTQSEGGREQANLFHSTVDQLEETIVAMDAADLLKRQGSIIMKISMLQNRIDNFCTDVVRQSVGDKPTKMILKSASSKANRLLGMLYSLDDERNPYNEGTINGNSYSP